MKTILTAIALIAFSLVQAQNLTLESALAKANEQAPVVSARTELSDAQANLERILADPLLTAPAKLQAEQRAALAKANLDQATAQAQSSIAGAYSQLIEAQFQLRLAQKGLELSQRSLEVAQIRQRNGSGTTLDVRNAQNRLDDARSNATRAENGVGLAQASLRSLVGAFDSLGVLPSSPAMPENSALAQILERNPDLLGARQRAAGAKLQASVLDPSFAARADIDSANARANQADVTAKEVERGLRLQLDSLFSNLQAASRSLGIQQTTLANSRESLENDRKRLNSGLISGLTFTQSELTALQAELTAQQAQGAYLRAWYGLRAGGR